MQHSAQDTEQGQSKKQRNTTPKTKKITKCVNTCAREREAVSVSYNTPAMILSQFRKKYCRW